MDPRHLGLYMEPAKESVVLNWNLYGNIEPYATVFYEVLFGSGLKGSLYLSFGTVNAFARIENHYFVNRGLMMSAWDLHRAWPEAGLKVALVIFLPIIKAEGIRATFFPITMQTHYRTPTVR
ncbi:hypothetical protein NC651_022384 [Populus alba x Populus x berolinensis]|nr:hypothetical protein NC651_022384 [Populus alba x Populus x berolinensis]